jgi:hypothetical protein
MRGRQPDAEDFWVFPVSKAQYGTVVNRGMTARDYFAAQIIGSIDWTGLDNNQIARKAYDLADAMLEVRAYK